MSGSFSEPRRAEVAINSNVECFARCGYIKAGDVRGNTIVTLEAPGNIGGVLIFHVTWGTEIDCLIAVIKFERYAMKRYVPK